jgi:hypothetical protein
MTRGAVLEDRRPATPNRGAQAQSASESAQMFSAHDSA